MLTEQEMLVVAEKYMSFRSTNTIELVIINQLTLKKPYGNVFYYDSKRYNETGEFKHHVIGSSPFLVENKTGRVVNFGTARSFEFYLDEYERGDMTPSLDRYWYPETEKFSHK